MTVTSNEIDHAIEVFVHGFCVGKSMTHPYECTKIGNVWVMRDAPRRNPRDYRKEEWVAHNVTPKEVDSVARKQTRGRFFVCAVHGVNEPDAALREDYKRLGYRLLASEPLFIHRLKRIPRIKSPVKIVQIRTQRLAEKFGAATRTRPILPEHLVKTAPFRQYVAIDGNVIVGWVRSVDAVDSTWCSNMHVQESHRRRGIGTAMLAKMLRDDRAQGAEKSVLLSSHTGALLYPRVGYEQIGTLLIYAPKRK